MNIPTSQCRTISISKSQTARQDMLNLLCLSQAVFNAIKPDQHEAACRSFISSHAQALLESSFQHTVNSADSRSQVNAPMINLIPSSFSCQHNNLESRDPGSRHRQHAVRSPKLFLICPGRQLCQSNQARAVTAQSNRVSTQHGSEKASKSEGAVLALMGLLKHSKLDMCFICASVPSRRALL